MFVPAEHKSAAATRRRKFGSCLFHFDPVTVDQSMGSNLKLTHERQRDTPGFQQGLQTAIVITGYEHNFSSAAKVVAKAKQFVRQRSHIDRVVHNIPQYDRADWSVNVDQAAQSINRINLPAKGDKIAGAPMSPGVAEMQVGNDQDTLVSQPHCPAGIENDARNDFTRLMILGTAAHSTTDGRDAPAFQMGLPP